LLNRAQSNLFVGNFVGAQHDCTKALETINDKGSQVKAYFRRGKALYGLKDHEAAQADLKIVLSLDSENVDAKKLLAEIAAKVASEKKREQQVFSKMFS
jgi:tetratricopeptide (TPR) repeat protein